MSRSITKIRKLSNAGVLKNISAQTGSIEFKKYNLIYGFNGSGKTTLSRIFSSFELGEISPHLPTELQCDLHCTAGSVSFKPGERNFDDKLVVFNADYIARVFEWKRGAARAEGILYLGEKQADAARQRTEKADELKKVEDTIPSLRKSEAGAKKVFDTEAKRIGERIGSAIGQERNYNAKTVKDDYAKVDVESLNTLTKDEYAAKAELLKRSDPLPKILKKLKLFSDGISNFESGHKALATTVGATFLEELQAHPEMIAWVQKGARYHDQNDLDQCLHCGNVIDPERARLIKENLNSSFDSAVQRTEEVAQKAEEISSALQKLIEDLPIPNDIAPELRAEYNADRAECDKALRVLQEHFRALHSALSNKAQNLNDCTGLESLISVEDFSELWGICEESISSISDRVDKHNNAHEKFAVNQAQARKAIKSHLLAEEASVFDKAKKQLEADKSAKEEAEKKQVDLKTEIDRLTQQMLQSAPAIERINTMLESYLGHGELSLAALTDGNPGFEILRHKRPLEGPPSEGERTAFALCHFLTALSANGRNISDTIIVIDDPISSLDTRAQSYALGLIKEYVTDAAQVFVSTHQFHFATEVRRWMKQRGGKANFQQIFFSVEQGADGAQRLSTLVAMPQLLAKYDTEYVYLFDIVKEYADHPDGQAENAFLMPNAIRKLVESFLSFKFPDTTNNDVKPFVPLKRAKESWDGIEQTDVSVIDRVLNIASHGRIESHDGASLPSIEEAHRAAKAAIKLIRVGDPQHFEGLKSVDAGAAD